MKYEKFARIFDTTDGNQMLLTIDIDSEEERYWLRFRSEFHGVGMEISLGTGKNRKRLQKLLDEMTQETAQEKYDVLKRVATEVRS